MCGISGFVDFTKKSSLEHLKAMSQTLVHRGPDGEGFEFNEIINATIGLAHRRLSIIDLSNAGIQPMHYKHLCITYNGEIYNHAELRTELEQLGHTFQSHSDTEVILHAYEKWGIDMVSKFIGMFALVIYDSDRNEIICIRDRAGAKPFYYYMNEGLFLFSSELKAFHQHPNFKKEISPIGIYQYFQKGYISAPATIFKFCNKLLPGHYLKIELKNKSIKEIKYWDVYDYYNKPIIDISEKEAKEELVKILKSAFEYRMVADVPVGIFLSGGYDSSLVTAILQEKSSTPLNTFTIGFNENKYNEAQYAEQVASYLGTNHTEYFCTKKEAIDIIPELPFIYDEPLMDNSIIPTILVSKLAKKQVTVALSSDAGDEIFAGYTTYDHLLKYDSFFFSIPKGIKTFLFKALESIPLQYAPFINEKILRSQHKMVSLLKSNNILEANQAINEMINEKGLKKILPTATSTRDNSKIIKNSKLNTLLANDYSNYMCDDVLMKVDRAGMSVSLEGREPLLDHRIIEFAAQLPEKLKYKNGIKKYLLKEITHDYIPKEIMERPKMGFGIPISKWLDNELKELIDEYITEEKMNHYGILETKEIMILKHKFERNILYNKQVIWQILVFQLWVEKWM